MGLLQPEMPGWWPAGDWIGWVARTDQGHYGHRARKTTWLYVAHCTLPELVWTPCEQRLPPRTWSTEEERRRIVKTGMVQVMGRAERDRTPPAFRDLLLSIARTSRVNADGWRGVVRA
jgi:hypothetical protein